ncbi:MAG: S-layer homology domain-containing protein [Firmicutes bacterium]|nr:S-layer homology domain-containing protein [Bacillota bacterium]
MSFKKTSLVILLIVAFTLMLGVVVASAEGEQGDQPTTYTVKVEKPINGTATPSKDTATEGEQITITANPDAGYEFEKITVTPAATINGNSFTMPAANVTVTVTFKEKPSHKITKGATTNGNITVKETAKEDETVTVKVEPDDGYVLDTLTYTPVGGSATDISSSKSFTMPDKDVEINATFAAAKKITVKCVGNGTASASPNPAKQGDTIKITAKGNPETLYRVKSIKYGETDITNAKEFEMPAEDVTVTVEFEQYAYPITVNYVNAKTATASPNPAEPGQPVTVTAAPYSDQYEIVSITYTPKGGTTVTLTKTSDSGSFPMPDKDVTVNVTYKAKDGEKFDITVKKSTNGSATASARNSAPDKTITITPKPDEGYEVDKVTVTKDLDKSAVSVKKNNTTGSYSFTMPDGDATVEVTFKLAALKVNVAKVEHGKVTVDPKEAKLGDTVKITATPDKNYEVDLVVVADADGKSIKVKKANDGTYSFEMPATDVTVAVTFKEIACPSAPYKDLNTSLWYHEGVDYAIANGLMKGVSKDQFDPYGKLNRAMLVTILYRLEGEPRVTTANPFSDVEAGSWYDKAVTWADSKGIVNGYGNGKFGPTDNITREQMAAMMMRYASYKKIDTSKRDNLRSFVDAGSVSSWARENMQWAVAAGLIEGSNRKLMPLDATNRAEAATILMRFCEDIMK